MIFSSNGKYLSKEVKEPMTFKKVYDVFLQQGLSLLEATIASMIYTFEQSGLECKMSNNYVAKQLNVSERTVQNAISDLERKGFIINTHVGYNRILRVNKNVFCSKSDIFSDEDNS